MDDFATDFEDLKDQELKDLISKLLIYAKSLTRDLHKAEDLVQETLKKAIEGRKQYKSPYFTAWIKKIMKNTFIDSTRRSTEQELDEETDIAIEGEQESSLLKKDIDRCIAELKPAEREVVSLFGRGFSYKEISEFVGKSEGNLRVILLRSRKQLAECLGIIKR